VGLLKEGKGDYALGFMLLAGTLASASVLALRLKGRPSPSPSTSTDLPSRSPVACRPD